MNFALLDSLSPSVPMRDSCMHSAKSAGATSQATSTPSTSLTPVTQLAHLLSAKNNSLDRLGHVTLVSAGPGDCELLTVKAVKAISGASLVLYDHLVSTEVLELIGATAQRIYVGKRASHHSLAQDKIAQLMIELARSGQSLVRLKGGDCFIFGRGGEEIAALAQAGIPFSIIPGVSAAQGAAASTGIALTHRDFAGTLIMATGHRSGTHQLDMDWPMLARAHQTLVLYMGLANLEEISHQLIAHGLSATTPAAVIENATLASERCVVATLEDLPAKARLNRVVPPALIIVGEVVGARAQPTKPDSGATTAKNTLGSEGLSGEHAIGRTVANSCQRQKQA